MRLPCPICGERDHSEFAYRGDAGPVRPDAAASDAQSAFFDYVYLRDNPAGWHREYWYHEGGCRAWIIVERNTMTHEVRGATLPQEPPKPKTDAQGKPSGESPK